MSKKNKNKEKKHSNKKTVLITFLIFALFCGGGAIFTGAWRPFKSKEISEEAKTAYEQSDNQSADLFKDVEDYENNLIIQSGDYTADDLKTAPDYLPNGAYPYGFRKKDYGMDAEDGLLKEKECVLYTDFEAVYGFNTLFVYYMKNEDYAMEKYQKIKNEYCQREYKQESSNSRVSFGESSTGELSFSAMKKGTVVYYGMLGELENYPKLQHIYDKLGIDFKLPDIKTVIRANGQ